MLLLMVTVSSFLDSFRLVIGKMVVSVFVHFYYALVILDIYDILLEYLI